MILRNKKLAGAALSLAILGSSLTGASVVMAESASASTQQSQYQEVRVTIDGKLQKFPQSAILYEGSTLVPMRGVFEALEAKIGWDNPTRTVTATKGDTTIVLTIGNNYAHVNGQKVALAKEAMIVNGSTMVPLRFVAEALGAKVGWDAPTYTAIITNQGAGVITPGTGVTNPTTNPTKPTNPAPSERIMSQGIDATETNGRIYGSMNQKEYDTVLKMAKEAVANINNVEVPQAMLDYLYNGKRGENKPGLGFYNLELLGYEGQFSPYLEAGISADTLVLNYKMTKTIGDLLKTNKLDTTVSTPGVHSAYHAMVEGKLDCDSIANTRILILDLMGIENGIIAQTDHAFAVMKLDGQWVQGGKPIGTDINAFMKTISNASWYTPPLS